MLQPELRQLLEAVQTSLEQMMNQLKVAGISKFPLIIKGDVQGSVEAIVHALNRLSTDEIKVRVLHSGVGAITESDVTLASASGAPIIGFLGESTPEGQRQWVAAFVQRLRELAERGVLRGQRGAYMSAAEVAEVSVPATLQATIAARIDAA